LKGLEGENVNLKHELASLAVKNSQLRGEVTYLNDMIEKSSLAGAFQDLGAEPQAPDQSSTAPPEPGNSTPTSAVDAVETLAVARRATTAAQNAAADHQYQDLNGLGLH